MRPTALDAAVSGFKTRVLLNLCVGVTPKTTALALAQMREAGVVLEATPAPEPVLELHERHFRSNLLTERALVLVVGGTRYGPDMQTEQGRQQTGDAGLEAALARTEDALAGAARAAAALARELKRARSAAATGQVRELRRLLDGAVAQAEEASRLATAAAAAYDVCFGLLTVATMTRSMRAGSMPAFAIASAAASVARSIASVSAIARVRVMMPVRWRIHSSLESMGPISSSLGTLRSPRAAPYE